MNPHCKSEGLSTAEQISLESSLRIIREQLDSVLKSSDPKERAALVARFHTMCLEGRIEIGQLVSSKEAPVAKGMTCQRALELLQAEDVQLEIAGKIVEWFRENVRPISNAELCQLASVHKRVLPHYLGKPMLRDTSQSQPVRKVARYFIGLLKKVSDDAEYEGLTAQQAIKELSPKEVTSATLVKTFYWYNTHIEELEIGEIASATGFSVSAICYAMRPKILKHGNLAQSKPGRRIIAALKDLLMNEAQKG